MIRYLIANAAFYYVIGQSVNKQKQNMQTYKRVMTYIVKLLYSVKLSPTTFRIWAKVV